jgi:hypothetical protein
LTKKLADLSNFSIKVLDAPATVAELDSLANQFNSLMRQRLPNYQMLQGEFQGLNSLLGGAYDPARQMRVADRLSQAQLEFQRGANIDPNDFVRNIGLAARLRLLSAYASSGLTLRAAAPQEIEQFNRDRSTALNMRQELKELYKKRRIEMVLERSTSELNNQLAELKTKLAVVEDRLGQALTAGGSGPGQFGLVLGNMDAELSEEMRRAVRDYRAHGSFKGPVSGALRSKGNQIAVVLFYLQAVKFVEALRTFYSEEGKVVYGLLAIGDTFVSMATAGLAVSQGVAINVLQAHIEQMESAAGKLNSMSRLGRWSGMTGLGAYFFGAFAAGVDLAKHSNQWVQAITEGDGKKLGATSLQMSGDGLLVGTNIWALRHTSAIVREILHLPKELRALAWAQKSPQLVSIAARANLIGIVGTALQLIGEGLYNYFNLDEMKKWLHHSAWGYDTLDRSLEDDWTALATVVQQPRCQLIRSGENTELRLTLPGVRTSELDSRQVSIEAHVRHPSEQPKKRFGRSVYVPPYWIGCSEYVANKFEIVSQGDEALVLRLPIRPRDHESFGLALAVSYKLEDHRPPRHRTIFNVLNIHNRYVSGVGTVGEQGTFSYKSETELAAKLSPTEPWLLKQDELRDD